MLAVAPDRPYKTVAEMIAYAKANPDKLNYATAGLGSAPHLAGALFAQELGLKWAFIPMKGGAEAIQQVSGGHADALFNGMIATLPHVKNGKLHGLAVLERQAQRARARAADGGRGDGPQELRHRQLAGLPGRGWHAARHPRAARMSRSRRRPRSPRWPCA